MTGRRSLPALIAAASNEDVPGPMGARCSDLSAPSPAPGRPAHGWSTVP